MSAPHALALAPEDRVGLDLNHIRAEFPILRQRVHGKPLVYLDNGASAQAVAQWSADVAAGRKAMPQMTARLVALACAMLESDQQPTLREYRI